MWVKKMAVSYKRLWKVMIDKDVNKTELCQKTGISSGTMAKMTKDEPVTLKIQCDIGDIVEKIPDEETMIKENK